MRPIPLRIHDLTAWPSLPAAVIGLFAALLGVATDAARDLRLSLRWLRTERTQTERAARHRRTVPGCTCVGRCRGEGAWSPATNTGPVPSDEGGRCA